MRIKTELLDSVVKYLEKGFQGQVAEEGAAAQAGLSSEISEGRQEARPALASYSASPRGSGQPSHTLLEHAR